MHKTELCLNVRKDTAILVRELALRDQRHMRTIAEDAVQLYMDKYPEARNLSVPLKMPPGTNPKSTIIHIPVPTWHQVDRLKGRDHAPRYLIMEEAVNLYAKKYAKPRDFVQGTSGRGRPPRLQKELV